MDILYTFWIFSQIPEYHDHPGYGKKSFIISMYLTQYHIQENIDVIFLLTLKECNLQS